MEKKRLLSVAVTVLLAGLVCGVGAQNAEVGGTPEALRFLDTIAEAMSIIQNNYVEPVDAEKLIYGAIEGMLKALDPSSGFVMPGTDRGRKAISGRVPEMRELLAAESESEGQPRVEEFNIQTTGRLGGVGLEITKREGFVTVVSTIAGTPAAKAGLQPGDRIVKINDESLHDPDLQDVVSKLRGEPGTKVTVAIVRGQDAPQTITLTRATVEVPSVVEARILEDSIGYVKITRFQERTPEELDHVLTDLESKGMNAMVLDLRDNPGGMLASAVKVADLFVPGGHVIASTKGRRPAQNREYVSEDAGTHPTYPLAVLINGGTAKGAEITAAAIKELKKGVLVGETTYGGGTLQSIFQLRRGAAIKLTTTKWYTPNGVCIEGKGIEPHVVVPVTQEQEMQRRKQRYAEMEKALGRVEEEAEAEEEFVDTQLLEAVRILKALKAIRFEKTAAASTAKRSL